MQDVLRILCMAMMMHFCYTQSAVADSSLFVTDPILSRPTDRSVTITVVPKKILQLYVEYGTVSATYVSQTPTIATIANVPVKMLMNDLSPDTRYYYRLGYKENGASQFVSGQEFTFTTQRSKGSTFKFGITADSHLYDKKGIPVMMKVTMLNLQNARPDFVLDLGDTFGDDHQPTTIMQQEMMQLHLNFMPYIGMVCHSSHFFFCLGNHEGESGYYLLQTPPDNMAVYATLARKYYYANPYPDAFYTGNTAVENFGMGYPENYYTWEWGDALFVVLDTYRSGIANDKPEGWDWTLGEKQYTWFKQTLENSAAKYKFVFAHHIRGQGRGGIIMAKLFEWGGYGNNGTTWGFGANRSGWAMPIHQLMVNNGVNIFFQGHDHLFAQEMLDGLVYQEVPMPSDSTYMIGMLANADAYSSNQLNGTGTLVVTVAPTEAKVEYIRSYLPRDTSATQRNGSVAFSYTVAPRVLGIKKYNSGTKSIRLEQNHPNPFNPGTEIQNSIAEAGIVTLKVFDILGREVAVLVDGHKAPGSYTAKFSVPGTGALGTTKASGVFFYQLRSHAGVLSQKAIFIK